MESVELPRVSPYQRGWLLAATCSLILVACVGCSTRSERSASSAVVTVTRGKPCVKTISLAPKPGAEQGYVVSQTPIEAEGELPLVSRVATRLRERFVVHQPGEDILVVKPVEPRRPGSLFEEAIALNVIRGRLKTRRAIPRDVASRVVISEGTVRIPFGSDLGADDAAAAIRDALDVITVQRVRANFTAGAASGL